MPKIIENIRETIILEGRNLLLSKNYKELSIREIAKRCDMAVGTFYNYFSTKEELAIEIFKDDWEKIDILVEKLKETEEPFKHKINKIYIVVEEFLSSYMSVFYEMAAQGGRSSRDKQYINIFYEKISELIQIEMDKGNISSPLSANKLARLIISNLMYLSREKYMTFDELFDSFKL